ncbi:unnamed protein product [Discula destructiva]
MSGKRKASSSQRTGAEAVADDIPPAKRRKPLSDFPNLMKGESPESTTVYGLHFLDAIRRTSDKSGRRVSRYFEKLVPKKDNTDFYSKVHMPISLRVVERKLYRQEFKTLRELESWLKRMVTNVKEYYPKNSQEFEDAEKVRKATSNWFVKHNPAYKKVENYAATPIPIPPGYDVDAELAVEDMDPETAVAEMGNPTQRSSVHRSMPEAAGEGAAGEDEEMIDADADDQDDDDDADADADADDDVDDDAEADGDVDQDAEGDEAEVEDTRASGNRIVLRRGGGAVRDAPTRETNTPSSTGNMGSAQYSDVPYQGLTFQRAQEKIIDTLIKRKEDDDDEWPYFEPFIQLPDKSLKDYYQLIDTPMSLKKMWRAIQGMQGRSGKTGASLYKTWAAFEQEANLLWTNAQYYNEEGSEIYDLAGELRDAFYEQFNEARAVVQEPSQPKIKLRAPSAAQPPLSAPAKPKRITIHVGGGREGSQESPAPHAGPSSNAATPQPAPNGGAARPVPVSTPAATLNQGPATIPTGAAPFQEELARQTPAVPAQVSNGYSSSAFRPVMQTANGLGPSQKPSMVNGHAPVPAAAPAPVAPIPRKSLLDVKYRGTGLGVKDAVLTNLCIRTPLDNNPEKRFVFNVPPHPELLQQHFTINLGPTQWKLQIVARVSADLYPQMRPYKLFIMVNGKILLHDNPNSREPLQAGEVAFDASLHQGVNTISVHMIAALPEGKKMPNGADAVMEKILVLANVAKQ